jgi:4-carboxymuconolactone decarboxylase
MAEHDDSSARRARGREIFRQVMALDPPADGPSSPFVDNGLLDTVFAELWTRGGLTRKERRILTICCVAATAVDPSAIDAHVRAALATGDLTVSELEELTLHFAYYAGFPRASALQVALGRLSAQSEGESHAS